MHTLILALIGGCVSGLITLGWLRFERRRSTVGPSAPYAAAMDAQTRELRALRDELTAMQRKRTSTIHVHSAPRSEAERTAREVARRIGMTG